MSPSAYKKQAERDAPGVRHVAAFLCDFAQKLPKVTLTHISLVVPYLNGTQ